eukprot:4329477-Prorocentrum_lima.AAC.1
MQRCTTSPPTEPANRPFPMGSELPRACRQQRAARRRPKNPGPDAASLLVLNRNHLPQGIQAH